MISRAHRFNGFRSLNFVYKNGAIARGPMFAIKSCPNPQRSTYRAAVVISRKVHKSAVGRNKMRRRIYEAIRLVEDKITQPHDIVVMVFNDTPLSTTPAELNAQLRKQLKALKVI